MAKLGLAFVCGVLLAIGCGDADDDSGGTGGASSGGSSTSGGSATGGAAGKGGSGVVTGGSSAGGASAGGKASGGSVAVAGNAGSVNIGGDGGSSGIAGAAGDAGSGAGSTNGGAGGVGAAGGAGGAEGGASGMGGAGSGGGPDGCPPALPLKCGDSLNHSTLIQGRPNEWGTYSATQRLESGRETIYRLSTAGECSVVVRLKNLTTDLDLIRVPTCEPISGDKASSTPLDIQTIETLSWANPSGKAFYVVVDGYDGAEGSYTLEVECTCS